MKQELVMLTTKHKDFQGKKQRHIQGTKHRELMYRYCYKICLVAKHNYKYKAVDREFLHNDLVDKYYTNMIGREYILFTNNTVYYLDITVSIPAKQHYKKGKLYDDIKSTSYGVLGKNIYYVLQHVGKYVHSIKVIL